MIRNTFELSAFALVALFATVAPNGAGAQMRRSGGDAPAPAGEPLKGIPRDPRHPYAGVWQGTFTIGRPGGGGEDQIPVVMVLSLADSTTGQYAGFTVLPNGARAPHEETAVANGVMQWKQENSGGGYWLYVSKLVARDSLSGTVALKDWPQLAPGEKPPTGSILLVRRPPAT